MYNILKCSSSGDASSAPVGGGGGANTTSSTGESTGSSTGTATSGVGEAAHPAGGETASVPSAPMEGAGATPAALMEPTVMATTPVAEPADVAKSAPSAGGEGILGNITSSVSVATVTAPTTTVTGQTASQQIVNNIANTFTQQQTLPAAVAHVTLTLTIKK